MCRRLVCRLYERFVLCVSCLFNVCRFVLFTTYIYIKYIFIHELRNTFYIVTKLNNTLGGGEFNQTSKSWSFPLRGRGLGRGFDLSSLMTQSLTQDQINPSPENLSFAPRCVAQLDFLPSPTRGEGSANIPQTSLGYSLALQERYRLFF